MDLERLSESLPRWLLAGFSASAALWASAPGTIKVLVIAMALDFVSGYLASCVSGEGLSSHRGKRGLATKLMILLALGLAYALDTHLLGLTGWVSITSAFAVQFTVNEVLSFCENAGRAGLPLPGWLAQMLTVLRDNLANRVMKAIGAAVDEKVRNEKAPTSEPGGASAMPGSARDEQ